MQGGRFEADGQTGPAHEEARRPAGASADWRGLVCRWRSAHEAPILLAIEGKSRRALQESIHNIHIYTMYTHIYVYTQIYATDLWRASMHTLALAAVRARPHNTSPIEAGDANRRICKLLSCFGQV